MWRSKSKPGRSEDNNDDDSHNRLMKQIHERIKECEIKKVINDLETASSKQERIAAIHTIYKEFDHNDIKKHNEEVATGAFQAICKVLPRLVLEERMDDEVYKICCTLNVICMCSDEHLESCLQAAVGQELLSLLSLVMSKSLQKLSPASLDDDGGKVLFCILTILNRFTDVKSLTLAISSKIELIKSLCLIIRKGSIFSEQLKAQAAGVIADIAAHRENVAMLLRDDDFLDVVIQAHHSSSIPCRRETLRIIQNVSFSAANEVGKKTFNIRNLLSALLLSSKFEDDEMRRLAVGAIWNLTGHAEWKIIFASHNDGAFVNELLQLICDDDKEVRHSAFCALRNLSSGNEKMAYLVNLPDFLPNISYVISSDVSRNVRISAAKLLRDLSKFATPSTLGLQGYEYYFDALAKATTGCGAEAISILTNIVTQQTSAKKSRVCMMNYAGVYETIIKIISTGTSEDINEINKVIGEFQELIGKYKSIEIDDKVLKAVTKLGLLCGTLSPKVDFFVVCMLHHYKSCDLNVNKMTEIRGVLEYLVDCGRRNEDFGTLRNLVSETLEVLIRSWRVANDIKTSTTWPRFKRCARSTY